MLFEVGFNANCRYLYKEAHWITSRSVAELGDYLAPCEKQGIWKARNFSFFDNRLTWVTQSQRTILISMISVGEMSISQA